MQALNKSENESFKGLIKQLKALCREIFSNGRHLELHSALSKVLDELKVIYKDTLVGEKYILEHDREIKEEDRIDPKIKAEIDAMNQEELCRTWRFEPSGTPMLSGNEGEYFLKRLKEKGGFTPEISKKLGWE